MFPFVLPQFVEIAIVGAGPQALTLATRLLQKRQKLRHRFMVFDGSGTWLNQWQHQFAAQAIPHLPLKTSRSRRFQLILSDGSSILARRVVLATGSSITQFPDWVKQIPCSYHPDKLIHSQQVDLRSLHLKGDPK